MALTNPQLVAIRNTFVNQALTGPCPYTKADLLAAATAADAWATANAASFNAALPDPFKSLSTAAQKAALLAMVAQTRWAG